MLENITIGIVAGLVTAFITIVLRSLWIKVLIPWFEELLYKDIKIEGIWNGVFIDSIDLAMNGILMPNEENLGEYLKTGTESEYQSSEIRMNLKRNGYKISGTFLGISGSEKGTISDIRADFKNLLLSGVYETSDKAIIDKGSFNLIAINNGKVLKGYFSAYENGSHSIRPFYCLLKKEE